MVVWKYEISVVSKQTISVPENSQGLTIKAVGNKLFCWALVDDSINTLETQEQDLLILATGELCSTHLTREDHVATVILDCGEVYHIFEG